MISKSIYLFQRDRWNPHLPVFFLLSSIIVSIPPFYSVANGEDGGWLEEERERERQKTEKEGASIIKNVILPLLNISRELQAEALQSE